MSRPRDPFGLFQKKLACGKIIYYYTTYDSEGRRRQFSTGETEHKAALREVLKRSHAGRLVPNDRLVFGKWTEDWFIYEQCPFIKSRLTRGFSYSRVHSENRRSYLVTYLWPTFHQKVLSTLRTVDIENWTTDLLRQGRSRDLVNRCLGTLKIILSEAFRLGLISSNPSKSVLPLNHESKEKGILSNKESAQIFDPKNWEIYWPRKYIGFLALSVSFFGGLRQGELIGLQVEDLLENGILVCHGWDRRSGLKGTKNGIKRFVPLPSWLLLELKKLSPEGHVFSFSNGKKSVSATYLNQAFSNAMEILGIDREAQKVRNLGSHSLRHGLVSHLLGSGVPASVVAQVVGHETIKLTTSTYHHTTSLHTKAISDAQKTMSEPLPPLLSRIS